MLLVSINIGKHDDARCNYVESKLYTTDSHAKLIFHLHNRFFCSLVRLVFGFEEGKKNFFFPLRISSAHRICACVGVKNDCISQPKKCQSRSFRKKSFNQESRTASTQSVTLIFGDIYECQ